jgi:uncharacterized protein (TIGR02246 family)
MRPTIFSFAPLMLVSCVACAPSTETRPTRDTAADEEALRALVARDADAFSASDLDAIMALYSADAVQMPPNQPIITGKRALRDSFQSFLEHNSAELKATVEDVRTSGDWAYVRASYEQSMTPTGGGETVDEVGKWVLICQREAGGDWKIVSEIWNLDQPPAES